MNEYKQQSSGSGRDCPPPPDKPAKQPPAPIECKPLPPTTAPDWPRPNDCAPPDPDCNCPPKSTPKPTCLDDLIDEQAAQIAAADRAKAFKTTLEALLKSANTAAQAYTRDKYDQFVKQWISQDRDIAELIRRLVCAVPCWKCVIDCYVCPLLDDLHNDEKWLNGDGKPPEKAASLYDMLYWRQRDRDIKAWTFARIEKVLGAWDKPAATLEKALNEVKSRIEAAGKAVGGSEPAKIVFDVFVRLVPLHLAIAPPDTVAKTMIDVKYTESCLCDKGGDLDVCCGPNVGLQSLRERMLGPQPYLLEPSKYFDLICCLVTHRYGPAKEALTEAEAELAAADKRVKDIGKRIDDAVKSFDKLEQDAKAAIPSMLKCCDEQLPKDKPTSSTSTAR